MVLASLSTIHGASATKKQEEIQKEVEGQSVKRVNVAVTTEKRRLSNWGKTATDQQSTTYAKTVF